MKKRVVIALLLCVTFGANAALAGATNASGLDHWAFDSGVGFEVTSLHCGAKSITANYDTETAQGMFCVVGITLKNTGTTAVTPDDSVQYLYDVEGRQYSVDSDADGFLNTSSIWDFETLNPGLSISGSLYYDVPVGIRISRLEVHGDDFSKGASISLERAQLGAWAKDKVVDGVVAVPIYTEVMNTTCARSLSNKNIGPSSVMTVKSGGRVLATATLGTGTNGSDKNARGKKVKTCTFISDIWLPLNETSYVFEYSGVSDGKAKFSNALLKSVTSTHHSLELQLS